MPSNLQPITTSLNFGAATTGTVVTLIVQFQNYGDEDCTISDVFFAGGVYGDDSAPPIPVAAGDSVSFHATFTAGTPGVTPATQMVVVSDDPGSPINIPASSESVAPGVGTLSVSPSSFNFPNTKVDEDSAIQVFTVTNNGNIAVHVSGATFPTGFLAASPIPSYAVTLTPGNSLTFGCTFSPVGQGYANGNISIASDADSNPTLIPVSGIAFLITPAYIATGAVVLLAAFGNTVLQFDHLDLNCEVAAFVRRDVNMTSPGYEDSMLQMQVNHEAKGASLLTMTVESPHGQTPTVAINLNTATNDKIRAAFGNMNSSVTGEVLTITLAHAANGGPVSMTGYIIRHVVAGEVKP